MADTRVYQVLEQIRDSLGFPSPASTLFGLAALNTTASLNLAFTGQTASNVSAAAGQLATLNTTASNSALHLANISGRLQFHHHVAASGMTVVQVTNPPVGETVLRAGAAFLSTFVHSMHFRGAVFHASPSRQFTIRQVTGGTDKFAGHVGASNAANAGVFQHSWNFNDTPWQLPVAADLILNIATGFTCQGVFSAVIHQTSPQ